jgi:hypothetical protein
MNENDNKGFLIFKKIFLNILPILEKEIKNESTKNFIKNNIVIPLIYVIYLELKPLLYTILILIIVLLALVINLIYCKLIF